jgi:signal peptidase I
MHRQVGQGGKFRAEVKGWAGMILLLLFGTTMLMQAYVVPTGSMETTIMTGDHLFVDKLCYSPPGPISKHLLPYREVQRGDIVVFRAPINLRENYVKRVIGLPGDRIHIVSRQVFVNGKALDEPYKRHIRPFIDAYMDNFPPPPEQWRYKQATAMLAGHVTGGEVVVPAGHYFVMGDNRDDSLDSRGWGFVPRANILGKPLFVYWSYDAPTERLASGNLNPEHVVDIALNFFSKTRWDRMFLLIRAHPIR